MKMENVKRMKGGMLKEGARLTCQVCAKEAEYLRNVGQDLDAGKEIWVPRCESCKDVKMGTGYPDP